MTNVTSRSNLYLGVARLRKRSITLLSIQQSNEPPSDLERSSSRHQEINQEAGVKSSLTSTINLFRIEPQTYSNPQNKQKRTFSSKSTDPPRSTPIPIHKTPRGAVAASRLRPHEPTTSSINGIHKELKAVEGGHNPIHFLKGGTPCDPAVPPFRLADYGEESLYTLVLLRHGESEWNSLNKYTGWTDVNLTKKGEMEARAAGRLLFENGIELDHAFTSVLKRASFSTNMALNMAKQHWIPVTKSWRLNERHYGALQGYNKDDAWKELGIDQEVVMQMRRSYDTRPPIMQDDHPYWHGNDRRYRKLSPEQLDRSRAESLKDTADRVMPFFNSVIVPSLRAGNKCLVVSHANTIRTLVKHIDNISDEDIKGMSIPTGIPLLYRLDKDFQPVDPNYELEFRYMVEPKGYTWATSRKHGFHGVYLGDLERLQDIQRKRDITNRNWQRIILHNIVKTLVGGTEAVDPKIAPKAIETRQLWWQVHERMQTPEYNNMLLLIRMKDHLEDLMYNRKQKFLTLAKYESIVNQLHLDAKDTW